MIDITKEESQNGIRMSWNVLPSNPIDLKRYIIPCGIHYTPLKPVDNLQLLEYEPIQCKACRSTLAPSYQVDFRSKAWVCPFCDKKNLFPKEYADYISEVNLPAELLPESTTIEYKLNRKPVNPPVFMFIIDTAIEESELQELKETIQNVLSSIPSESKIGIVLFGKMCSLVELAFTECPKMFIFKGDKEYKPGEIAEQLNLHNNNKTNNTNTNSNIAGKFLVPLKDCEFTINSFLDDLFPDPFPQETAQRKQNCCGLALNVAISLLEAVHNGEPSRIMLFSGGPCNIGMGKIVDVKLTETIRNYLDFDNHNPNINHFKKAIAYYESLADRAFKANQIVDIFSCCLNQIGLLEMKFLVEKTGGLMLLTDSFSTFPFKDTFNKLFAVDDDGNLKMSFGGKCEMFVTQPLLIQGAFGHMVSLNQNTLNMVSKTKIGEGNTRSWNLGGIDSTSSYCFMLDVNANPPKQALNLRYATIQFVTTYISGDLTTRMRVTTIRRKLSPDCQSNKYEVSQSFDQEASTVLLAKHAINMSLSMDRIEVLRYIDRSLIHLCSRFAEYTKDQVNTFKLTKEFMFFPQFVFYLRRSYVLQNFNASPDEITHFKTSLLRENVVNCMTMIQPSLYAYSPEQPEAVPVFLEIENMKSDWVLLLDAFFFVCIWHGEDVCKWRDAGYQNQDDYENVKLMLDSPQEYAQSLIAERIPTPRFISADYGSGQERLIKSALDPNIGGSEGMKEGYFVSDDVSLKVFMEHLIKKAVSS